MTGQYQLLIKEEKLVKELVEKYITSYEGDLFEDNEISIKFAKKKDFEGKSWAYVQIN